MELKYARDRLQSFQSEVPDITPNDFDIEHPVFTDKNAQIIDSWNNNYGLLSNPTAQADSLALLSRPAKTINCHQGQKPDLDPVDRHQSNRLTILDTYNPRAGTDPNDTDPCLAQNQYFSQPQPQPLAGTDASGSNCEKCTSASVALGRQMYDYIEARPCNFLQSQLGGNWGNTSETTRDNAFPSVITEEQMAELFGSADIGFSQNEGSFSFKDLL